MPHAELFYHIVMGIESEEPLHKLTKTLVETRLEEGIDSLGGKLIDSAVMPDHVHLLVMLPPGAPIDTVVYELKESTGQMVEGMGREESLEWSRGYGVVSVSRSHLDILEKYLSEQEKRHSSGNVNETLEKIEP